MKTTKRILMFGWEYPPHISGGLGTACSGLTAALSDLGHDVLFIAPHLPEASTCGTVKTISLSGTKPSVEAAGGQSCTVKPEEEEILIHRFESHTVTSLLTPYLSERLYEEKLSDLSDLNGDGQQIVSDVPPLAGGYGSDLISEVIRYSRAAAEIAGMEHFDIIHGHDWMSILAGLEARRISGKPFILHIHALEWDRAGDNYDPVIFDMERYGMAQADHIVSVSYYTKDIMCEKYGIEPAKITVVHNAINRRDRSTLQRQAGSSNRKVVLFLGRITYQKGP
ncbi:MAG: glycosyltransferase family 4 protein [Syntrophales bacterium]|jgi:glycosyltransferase involved in cell wall biosynthesis